MGVGENRRMLRRMFGPKSNEVTNGRLEVMAHWRMA